MLSQGCGGVKSSRAVPKGLERDDGNDRCDHDGEEERESPVGNAL